MFGRILRLLFRLSVVAGVIAGVVLFVAGAGTYNNTLTLGGAALVFWTLAVWGAVWVAGKAAHWIGDAWRGPQRAGG